MMPSLIVREEIRPRQISAIVWSGRFFASNPELPFRCVTMSGRRFDHSGIGSVDSERRRRTARSSPHNSAGVPMSGNGSFRKLAAILLPLHGVNGSGAVSG